MFNFSNNFKTQFYRASTIFSSGFGSASFGLWATTLFLQDTSNGALLSTTGSLVAGLSALAGAGCAHAYFAGGDDRSADYEEVIRKDSVTGLLSRNGLENELPKLFEETHKTKGMQRVFLVCMDFDELRDINDVYGAEIGNEVLKVLAKRLADLVGDTGPLVRTNGSEFVVGLRAGRDERELRAAVTALMDTLSKPVRIGAVTYPVYANGGVVQVHKSDAPVEKLLRQANLARTSAKKSGRGSYAIYHPEMSHNATYRQWIETELTYAIQRNEFSLHYQPQVKSPSVKFSSDTIISVNVSTAQIEEADFINTLQTILAETGLPAERLELEVTESVLIQDHLRMRRLFSEIKQLGVAIAIDDFGTGYSNLTNLSELAFDKIKIDKSFVERLGEAGHNGSMISTIVNLAMSLGAKVVAEGIETEEQAIILNAAGCTIMQGFYYGRPLPIHELKHNQLKMSA
ncbi:hypothetical protein GQR58_028382 [Nymphon striatum]|nr:hypothetical protein GQR58_028382 [Nymphon striatum]